jgi:hypothetical protein
MRLGRKRITGDEAVVVGATNSNLPEEMKWFYEEIKAKRATVTEEALANLEKEIAERGITHFSDICYLFDWVQGRDTEKRNRLAKLGHIILLANNGNIDHAAVVFAAMKRGLKEDVKEPIDLVLSKNEARKARKIRKSLKKNDVDLAEKMNLPKSNDAKVAARKERARIRKEAKAAGISTADYKAKEKATA